jgi:putative oxidoreductase
MPEENRKDLGILLLRVLVPGTLFFAHGLGKLTAMPGIFQHFPDPIGLGSTFSASVAIFAEAICAAAVVLGIFTRITILPIIGVMLVAILFQHASDPFATKELAVLYLIPSLTLFITGGGRYVLNRKFLGKS